MAFRGQVSYQQTEEEEKYQYLSRNGSISATVIRRQLTVNCQTEEKGCLAKFMSLFSSCQPSQSSQYKRISRK